MQDTSHFGDDELNSLAGWPARGLYAITDGPRPDLLEVVAQALAGGARLLQYRDETGDGARRLAEAQALADLCRARGVPLIIGADVVLAGQVGADGVHLDTAAEVAAAREALGARAVIGVSCRGSLDTARVAVAAGASYVSFGVMFPSTTKPLAPCVPHDLLRQSAALGVPRVAIGGITPENGASLVEAGADCLAAISALFGATDVRAAAASFASLYSPDRETAR